MKGYSETQEDRSQRSYTLDDDSSKVIAFTTNQVEDIANFCSNDKPGFKSLLFADSTFQLGPFYLLLI